MSLFVVKLLSVTLLQYLVKNGSHSRLLLAPSSNLSNKRPASQSKHTDSALLKGTWYAVLNTHKILGFMYGILIYIWLALSAITTPSIPWVLYLKPVKLHPEFFGGMEAHTINKEVKFPKSKTRVMFGLHSSIIAWKVVSTAWYIYIYISTCAKKTTHISTISAKHLVPSYHEQLY